MRYRATLLISIVAMLLAGCSGGGPSNAEAKEVIYGVYLQDASIVEKGECELTPKMEEEGQKNIWLVRYKFKKSGTEGGMLLAETDSDEYPWEIYMPTAESCP